MRAQRVRSYASEISITSLSFLVTARAQAEPVGEPGASTAAQGQGHRLDQNAPYTQSSRQP
jgi:hypothetical protein